MAPTEMDNNQLRTLAADGLSPYAIAKRLGLPPSTVRDRLKKLHVASPSDPPTRISTQSTPSVHTDVLAGMMSDLQDLVAWWHERKAALDQAHDASRKTERTTFHVEQRWIEAIRRKADLDNLTYTQIVNEAFRQYFERP